MPIENSDKEFGGKTAAAAAYDPRVNTTPSLQSVLETATRVLQLVAKRTDVQFDLLLCHKIANALP
jgi:hypothetical protein